MAQVTLADVLTLPALQGAQVIAGHAGLDRAVLGVNVMEVPDIEAYVAPGELLLTTAYPVRERPERLVELLQALDARHLAGLAIKPLRYLDRLPSGLVEEADRLGFPVLVVADHTSFNEVIGAVLAVVLADYGAEPARAEAIRERLTGVALSGGGLDEIARTLGGAVQQEVAIIDTDDGVLGRSGAIADDAGALALPWRFPITVAGAQRGCIAVGGASEPTLGQRRLIRQACFAAGMHLAQALAALDLDRRMRVLFLEELVTGPPPDPDIVRLRSRLFGWDLTGERAVALARNTSDISDAAAAAATGVAFGASAAAWTRGNDIVAIVPLPKPAMQDLVLGRWREALREQGAAPTVVALGSVAVRPDQLAASHAAARETLRIGELTAQPIVRQDSVALERLLLAIPAAELHQFVDQQIGPLIEVDNADHSDLCGTLETYLTVGNGAEAARRCYIHYNTLKHRLARISALLGADLHEPRQRTALALALAARRVAAFRG